MVINDNFNIFYYILISVDYLHTAKKASLT